MKKHLTNKVFLTVKESTFLSPLEVKVIWNIFPACLAWKEKNSICNFFLTLQLYKLINQKMSETWRFFLMIIILNLCSHSYTINNVNLPHRVVVHIRSWHHSNVIWDLLTEWKNINLKNKTSEQIRSERISFPLKD